MPNKNPTAWEYDHDERPDLIRISQPYRRRMIVEVIRENPHRSCFYDDPEHDKVKP